MRKLTILCAFTASLLLTGCEKIQANSQDSAVYDSAAEYGLEQSASAEGSEYTEAGYGIEKLVPTENSEETFKPAPADIILQCQPQLEFGEAVTAADFVVESNAVLMDRDELIATDSLGAHTTKLRILGENEVYEKEVAYVVADTVKPIILNNGSGMTHLRGNVFDINKCVGVADNCDDNPKITYTGDFDANKNGTYKLDVTAADASGNETTWKMTVHVKDKKPSGSKDARKRLAFADFMRKYPGENIAYGIDVSRWQNEIDFEKVKAAGCQFVIMRIGTYCNELGEDKYFAKNFENARKAGLKVGIYFYTTLHSEAQVHESTEWIVKLLDGAKLDFPVMFDWESFSNYQQYGISQYGLNRLYHIFAEDMQKKGYQAMLYGSKNVMENFWTAAKEGPIWLAHYVNETTYQGDYSIWQCSCIGNIDGIDGDVDLDLWYTDRPLFAADTNDSDNREAKSE